jgi:predicted enzyme related to lactoylglutathione lyase
MKFASTRLVASDIKAMVGFYEMVTGQRAEWLAPVFAEIVTPSATLAIGSAETVALFKEGSAEPAANRTAIIEFQVDDVDAEFARLKDNVEVMHDPKMMPWEPCGAVPRPRRDASRHVYAGGGRGEGAVRVAVRRGPYPTADSGAATCSSGLRSALMAYRQAMTAAANMRQAAKT